MDEYIKREAAKRAVDEAVELSASEYDMICDYLDRIPAADVVPAFHGYKHGLTRGECMRRARNRAEMSIRQLSKLSGVPGGTISMLENNTSRCGRIDTLELLADALHISVDEYVGHYR